MGALPAPSACLQGTQAMAAEDENTTFETGDSGASHVYPMQCGDLRKGSHVMIKGHPCKMGEISTSKTGKHGHAKAHIVALDIFTGKKYEDLCPTSHNVEVPFVKRVEYQLLTADESTGNVSLLLENGETKDDLNLPTFVQIGEPTDEDKKLTDDILKAEEAGDNMIVTVLSACGTEKLVSLKATKA